jgi:hypothetical protein
VCECDIVTIRETGDPMQDHRVPAPRRSDADPQFQLAVRPPSGVLTAPGAPSACTLSISRGVQFQLAFTPPRSLRPQPHLCVILRAKHLIGVFTRSGRQPRVASQPGGFIPFSASVRATHTIARTRRISVAEDRPEGTYGDRTRAYTSNVIRARDFSSCSATYSA